jgi:hypothetical protein
MLRRNRGLPAIGLVIAAAAITLSAAIREPVELDPTEFAPTLGEGEDRVVNRQIPGNQSSAHVPAAFVPRPTPLAVAGTGTELGTHFSGLNFHNQRIDTDGGRQFSLEPPDQALCAGNGLVVEAVNSTFAVYDAASGSKTSGFESLNQFFFGDHAIVRSPSVVYGTFIADPKCIYDPGSDRFFMTVTTIA